MLASVAGVFSTHTCFGNSPDNSCVSTTASCKPIHSRSSAARILPHKRPFGSLPGTSPTTSTYLPPLLIASEVLRFFRTRSIVIPKATATSGSTSPRASPKTMLLESEPGVFGGPRGAWERNGAIEVLFEGGVLALSEVDRSRPCAKGPVTMRKRMCRI